MGTLDTVMSKAYEIKENVYGEKHGYMKPRDIHPHIRSWIVSLALTVWAVVIVPSLFQAILVLSIWLVTQWSFYRSRVLL